MSVVCCQVDASANGRFLVQRSPTDCGVSLCVIQCNNDPPQSPWGLVADAGLKKLYKSVRSAGVKPYGECVYMSLKRCVDGPIVVVNGRNT